MNFVLRALSVVLIMFDCMHGFIVLQIVFQYFCGTSELQLIELLDNNSCKKRMVPPIALVHGYFKVKFFLWVLNTFS